MSSVKFLFKSFWWGLGLSLLIKVLFLQVFVVELIIEVFMIIDPWSDHMRILLMEVHCGWLSSDKDWLVVADVVSLEGSVVVDQRFSPKVWVRSAFMHGSIRLKLLFDVGFVLLQHKLDLLLILGVQDLVKISTDLVLFIVESVEVGSLCCEHMLSLELSQSASKTEITIREWNTYIILRSSALR